MTVSGVVTDNQYTSEISINSTIEQHHCCLATHCLQQTIHSQQSQSASEQCRYWCAAESGVTVSGVVTDNQYTSEISINSTIEQHHCCLATHCLQQTIHSQQSQSASEQCRYWCAAESGVTVSGVVTDNQYTSEISINSTIEQHHCCLATHCLHQTIHSQQSQSASEQCRYWCAAESGVTVNGVPTQQPYISGFRVESTISQHHSPQPTLRLCTSGAVNSHSHSQHSENTNGSSAAHRGAGAVKIAIQLTSATPMQQNNLDASAPLVLPLWPYCDWWC